MFKRTHELPQIQLTDPIWTVEHISAALRIGERAVRDVIKRSGFPTPSRLGSGPTARLYWVAQDVLDYMRTQAARPVGVPVARLAQPTTVVSPAAPVLPSTARNHSSGAVLSNEDALAAIAALPTTRTQVTR
jgi:predicted DNA-binding transcriptional regulator AlpA